MNPGPQTQFVVLFSVADAVRESVPGVGTGDFPFPAALIMPRFQPIGRPLEFAISRRCSPKPIPGPGLAHPPNQHLEEPGPQVDRQSGQRTGQQGDHCQRPDHGQVVRQVVHRPQLLVRPSGPLLGLSSTALLFCRSAGEWTKSAPAGLLAEVTAAATSPGRWLGPKSSKPPCSGAPGMVITALRGPGPARSDGAHGGSRGPRPGPLLRPVGPGWGLETLRDKMGHRPHNPITITTGSVPLLGRSKPNTDTGPGLRPSGSRGLPRIRPADLRRETARRSREPRSSRAAASPPPVRGRP
jgi:hypothetical protein